MATPEDVRKLFKAKLKEGIPIPPGEFDPLDLTKVDDDKYLLRILVHVENNVKYAADMLWDIMVWRKTVGANNINANTINMGYINDGTVFSRGRDIDGALLLIIDAKTHVRGQRDMEELKKVIIYWFDRMEREENGRQVSLFFDMTACGLANMDMEFVKFFVSLKNYYPNFVNYIIVFEMAWILSASFKIIKSLLPAKVVAKMKFLTKHTLKEIVAPEQALKSWGGKDDYVFQFIPEKKAETQKKVTFIERNVSEISQNNYSEGEILQLSPSDVIIFTKENDELTGQFTIKNMDEGPISFKIKSTSPEKFKVRPSSEVLAKGVSQNITITVLQGYHVNNVAKDRFLVLAVQIPKLDIPQNELAEIWQKSSSSKVDEYRLKCQFPQEVAKNGHIVKGQIMEDKIDSMVSLLKSLQNNQEVLQKEMASQKTLHFLTYLLIMMVMVLGFLGFMKAEKSLRYCNLVNSDI